MQQRANGTDCKDARKGAQFHSILSGACWLLTAPLRLVRLIRFTVQRGSKVARDSREIQMAPVPTGGSQQVEAVMKHNGTPTRFCGAAYWQHRYEASGNSGAGIFASGGESCKVFVPSRIPETRQTEEIQSTVATRREVPVFVSLTTISSRLSRLSDVLNSLLSQTITPDRIILNISSEPYLLDSGIAFGDLPLAVRDLIGTGLVEIYGVRNTGPYRKLLPTLRRFSSSPFLVATADDDAIYPPLWLEGLYEAYMREKCIISYRCRVIEFRNEKVAPYTTWPLLGYDAPEPSSNGLKSVYLLPTGVGGVFYHSRFFPDLSLLDSLRELAPKQDDLALRVATLVQNIPVYWAHFSVMGRETAKYENCGYTDNLYLQNCDMIDGVSPNDAALQRMVEFCLRNGLGTEILTPFGISQEAAGS